MGTQVKSFADKKELRNLSANVAAIEEDLSTNAARIAELEEEAAAKEKVMGEQRSACNGTELMHQELERQPINILTIHSLYSVLAQCSTQGLSGLVDVANLQGFTSCFQGVY